METFAEVIDALSGALEADLGISKGRQAVWKHRKRIPPEMWVPVASLNEAKENGITSDLLIRLEAKRKAEKGRAA